MTENTPEADSGGLTDRLTQFGRGTIAALALLAIIYGFVMYGVQNGTVFGWGVFAGIAISILAQLLGVKLYE